MALSDFVILPALAMGIILGLLELYFVSKDERGMHWLKHGLHALPVMFIFIFVAMNLSWALGLAGLEDSALIKYGVLAAIAIIAMVKVKAAASITGKGGVGESNIHVFIIGILIAASPFIWELLLEPMIGDMLPF